MKSRFWHKPGAEPEKSDGSAHYEWILDGRILQSHFKGDMGGMPFHGVGHNGYDKVKGEYFGTWMDSMSTGMAVFRSEWALPTEKDPDTMRFSMYHKDEKGKEFKTMEMVYTRTK